MYLGFLKDRQKLGFSCAVDIEDGKRMVLLIDEVCIYKKSKQFILGILISISPVSAKVNKMYSVKSVENPIEHLYKLPERFVDPGPNSKKYFESYLKKLSGGSSSLDKLSSDKLVQSIIRKSETFKEKRLKVNIAKITNIKVSRNHIYQNSSINKNLKKITSLIFQNKKLLKLLSLMEKPYYGNRTIPPQTPESASIGCRPDILDPSPDGIHSKWIYNSENDSWGILKVLSESEEEKVKQVRTSIFAQALKVPPRKTLVSLSPRKKYSFCKSLNIPDT